VSEVDIMYTDLLSTTVELHHEELLREAERARLAVGVRERHAWRHRIGAAMIRAGRALAEEPPEPVARHRARVA
jgi:hypothetical protein